VGGNAAREVARGLSVATIEDFLLNTLKWFSNLQANEEQDALRDLQKALLHADSRIFEEAAKHPEWRGMATTITFAFAVNWRLFVAHAGDCRCYLFSGGSLQRLTQDHTLTAELVREGAVAPADAARHPFRLVVTNILGGDKPGVNVELHSGVSARTDDDEQTTTSQTDSKCNPTSRRLSWSMVAIELIREIRIVSTHRCAESP
jgi:protein phosphatase